MSMLGLKVRVVVTSTLKEMIKEDRPAKLLPIPAHATYNIRNNKSIQSGKAPMKFFTKANE